MGRPLSRPPHPAAHQRQDGPGRGYPTPAPQDTPYLRTRLEQEGRKIGLLLRHPHITEAPTPPPG